MTTTLVLPPKKEGRVLLLHGWFSDGSYKSLTMTLMGYEVYTPSLSNWSFTSAVKTAQEAVDFFDPDVIVGSSRGGAVAMNLNTHKPLILLAPAWKRFGVANKVRNRNSVVIHSPHDDVVPYEDSVTLCANSRRLLLYAAGDGHRLNDPEARIALQECLEHSLGVVPFIIPSD